MTDLKELIEQKAQLDAKIEQTRREQKDQAIATVRDLVAQYSLTSADVGAKVRIKRTASNGGKLAPKYRDPATGNEWSGRGRRPAWMVKAAAAGLKVDEFRARVV